VQSQGAEAPSLQVAVESPETYLGYAALGSQIALPLLKRDEEQTYALPAQLALNQWSLGGQWTVQAERASLKPGPREDHLPFSCARLASRPRVGEPGDSRSLHRPAGWFITRKDHGMDIDASGRGVIQEQRLYQLIRQSNETSIRDRTFEIEFSDPGVQAFAFTFG